MRGRGVLAMIAFGALVLVAVFWWPESTSPTGPPAPIEAAPAEADPAPEPAPRRRIPIPRPEARPVPRAPAMPPAPTERPVADRAHKAEEAPKDFPEVRTSSDDFATDFTEAMEERQAALVGCLAGWQEAQPDVFEGRVVFGMTFDEEGMAVLEVLDVETVPEDTLGCLGDVLWDDVDWPLVDEPVDVTWPIQLSVRDD